MSISGIKLQLEVMSQSGVITCVGGDTEVIKCHCKVIGVLFTLYLVTWVGWDLMFENMKDQKLAEQVTWLKLGWNKSSCTLSLKKIKFTYFWLPRSQDNQNLLSFNLNRSLLPSVLSDPQTGKWDKSLSGISETESMILVLFKRQLLINLYNRSHKKKAKFFTS